METVILMAAVLMAALVMASGVWVAVVLAATVTRAKRPAPTTEKRAIGQADS